MKAESYALVVGILLAIACFGGGWIAGKHSGARDTTYVPSEPIPVQPDTGAALTPVNLDSAYSAWLEEQYAETQHILQSALTLQQKLDSLQKKYDLVSAELRRVSAYATEFDSTFIVTTKGDTLSRGRLLMAFSPPMRTFGHSLWWTPIEYPPTQQVKIELYDPVWVKPVVGLSAAGSVLAFQKNNAWLGSSFLGLAVFLSLVKL